MEYTDQTKLYIQLQPSSNELSWFNTTTLPFHDTALVPQSELHMTVIHFGKIERFLHSLPRDIGIDNAVFISHIESLVHRWSGIVAGINEPIHLRASHLALLGATNHTLVVEFEHSELAAQLHSACLHELEVFLDSVGIPQVRQFMEQDLNLKNSLTLRPHVTIAKHYTGDLHTSLSPATIEFSPMKIVY